MPTVCTDIKLITFICKTNACIDLAHQSKAVHIKMKQNTLSNVMNLKLG